MWRNGRYLERKTLCSLSLSVLTLSGNYASSNGQLTAGVLFVIDLCGKKCFIAREVKIYPYEIFFFHFSIDRIPIFIVLIRTQIGTGNALGAFSLMTDLCEVN